MLNVRRQMLGAALAMAVLAAGLAGFGAAKAQAESAEAGSAYRIVAIGDSLAVGYQPGMSESSVPYGFADRLYEQALFRGDAALANYGIIGLRSEGLLRLLQGASAGKSLKAAQLDDFSKYPERERLEVLADGVGARTAELKASLADADLVVVTVGANDFSDYLQSLLTLPKKEAVSSLEGNFSILLNNYAENAEQVLRLTAKLAPRARILFSDQYLPLPQLFAPGLYDVLYEKAVGPITAAVDSLAAKLREEGIRADAVHVADKFKGKEGSMTHMAIQLGGVSQPDNHPNDEGYEAIAEAFAQAVWQEYRKPGPRPAGVPISVIVAGKESETDYHPVLKPPGITFVALRDISDAMGAELQWDDGTQTATFRLKGRVVSVTIGAETMTVDGTERSIPAPAYLQPVGKEKKTYVPLAVIADGLGFRVKYSKPLQTAFINA
ncbi:stalk domain-containing protein [Cohnella caldifontis]|uniref:stalk domain-containing protein n=1 Tax=Cohnella caldifontis TaxID=3027471 RepID=UPI0023ED6B08|nr:stalk domain-containing protein [Cohnella sp. YIM B05605]